MGGAPPLPLDFAPQGSKNGHFLPFFGGPPGALFGPKKGPHGPPRIPVGGVAKCPPRGPFDPLRRPRPRRPRTPWGSGSPTPPAPIGAASPVGLGVLGRKPPAGQDPMTSRGPREPPCGLWGRPKTVRVSVTWSACVACVARRALANSWSLIILSEPGPLAP